MNKKSTKITLGILLGLLLLLSLISVFALGNDTLTVSNDEEHMENIRNRDLLTNKEEIQDSKSTGVPDFEELEFETLEIGTYCSVGKRQGKILDDEEQFKSLWKDAFSIREPLFTLNFEEKRAIAAFLGDKPTGGYEVRIDKILASEKELDVNVNIVSPGKGCMVSMVMTQPYHIISFKDKAKRPVNFIVTDVVAEKCN